MPAPNIPSLRARCLWHHLKGTFNGSYPGSIPIKLCPHIGKFSIKTYFDLTIFFVDLCQLKCTNLASKNIAQTIVYNS